MSKGKRLRNLREGNSNTVVNKKSMEKYPIADEKMMENTTILSDGTWRRKDGSAEGGAVRLEYPNGDEYVGGLKDLKPHGKGTLTFKNGCKYEGEFANGNRHGEGKLNFSNGGVMVGSWTNGKIKGDGFCDLPEFGHFVGEFEDASPKNGRILFPDGIKYEGDFLDWKPNGKGRQIFPDGEKYEGGFKDGLYHGGGTYFRKNGHSMCGDWKDNKPSKEGYMTYWESYPCDPKSDSCLFSQGGEVVKVYGEKFKKFLLEMDNNFSEVLI